MGPVALWPLRMVTSWRILPASLHAFLSSGSKKDRLQSTVSFFTHSPNVFLGVPWRWLQGTINKRKEYFWPLFSPLDLRSAELKQWCGLAATDRAVIYDPSHLFNRLSSVSDTYFAPFMWVLIFCIMFWWRLSLSQIRGIHEAKHAHQAYPVLHVPPNLFINFH